jgi:hypothetical protein
MSNDQLTVEHISLLFTVFKRVQNGKIVQIPNIVLNSLWIENVSRSKAMREQISIFCNFETSITDIEALKDEMTAFVVDSKNSRDFQPEIDIEVLGIAEMNKMELRIECKHKSNWANESIRAARRSKFMCALVLALRKVPIYGPGGGDAALGSLGQPAFSVAVSADEAAKNRAEFAANKQAKRLVQAPKPDTLRPDTGVTSGTDYSGNTANTEFSAVQNLNSRNPAVDRGRDDVWSGRDDASISTLDDRPNERQSLDEVRGLLHKESSKGRRQPAASTTSLTPIEEPVTPLYGSSSQPQLSPITALPQMSVSYGVPPPSHVQYAAPPAPGSQYGAAQQSPRGNAFASPGLNVQRRELPNQSTAYQAPSSAPAKGPY